MRISDWSSDVCSSDVYRAGAAARFGHNHVVTVPRLDGWLAMNGDDTRTAQFALHFRLDQLQIDDAALRIATGGNFGTPRSRSEEHTSELQSLMRNSYAVFCLNKTNITNIKIK